MFSVTTLQCRPSKSIIGFNFVTPMVAGIIPVSSARTAFIMEAIPLAASVCPMLLLTYRLFERLDVSCTFHPRYLHASIPLGGNTHRTYEDWVGLRPRFSEHRSNCPDFDWITRWCPSTCSHNSNKVSGYYSRIVTIVSPFFIIDPFHLRPLFLLRPLSFGL